MRPPNSHTKEDNGTRVEPPSSPRHREVVARWDPAKAQRPVIDEALTFRPGVEEFEDTLAYIEKIRPYAEPFGICLIIPPLGWSPPCRLKEKSIWEGTKFPTRIQNVDLLLNRESMKKKEPKGKKGRKPGRKSRMAPSSISSNQSTKEEKFGFNMGSDFTLKEFEKYDRDFKASYFERKNRFRGTKWAPSVEETEGEYWRIVEQPTDEVEVYYGADLKDGVLGSGFYNGRKNLTGNIDKDQYIASGWNLNNISCLPGSLLSFENAVISGVVVPWLYVGMCFSTFCWHVEDHHLYSLNYHHLGEPKVWYGVPGSRAEALEKAMRKHLPDLFDEQPDLLHGLVTQFSPTTLKEEGVPVYRLVQYPGEYVVTFPRAYHAGFNCGFNCAEAVNVAPLDWLSYGQNAVELYSKEFRKTSLSHDKILLGAAYEAVKSIWEENVKDFRWISFCGKNGTLTEALRNRLWIEEGRIAKALKSRYRLLKMDRDFDSNCEKDCFSCFYDLHLSASGCNKCSPGKYACTKHLKDLCSCQGDNDRFVLLRYTVDELVSLVRALEGEVPDQILWVSKINEDYSATQKGKSLLMTKEGEFDLNLDFQLDSELNASMKDFAAAVEPVNLGFLVFGKLWSNKDAIFPKGFKSRVKFFNVKDPTKLSYYISEVVDAGLMGPLFKVTLEESQEESFSNVSAQECWEMVLKRVNEEISKRTQAQNVHTLESIDGLKMFGFLSPAMIQATEALDPNHRLVEYWNHKEERASLEREDCFISNSSMSSTKARLFGVDLN